MREIITSDLFHDFKILWHQVLIILNDVKIINTPQVLTFLGVVIFTRLKIIITWCYRILNAIKTNTCIFKKKTI